ncbi:MAG: chorismate synthase [Candidatus Cryptobacteroides sp.]
MNTFGRNFRVTIFGESHGTGLGVVLDGVPAGIPLSADDFAADILRRKSGAVGTTPRIESDTPELLSGVFEGHTTGSPLTVIFRNGNTQSSDYQLFGRIPRPGHADYVASVKWGGYNDPRGGGHFSGRLTLPIVAAGVVAKKILGADIHAELVEVGGIPMGEFGKTRPSLQDFLREVVNDGDSIGGIVECTVAGLPVGLGEPFFGSVESLVSHAVFSIPGVRGIEFGDGFAASKMRGSQHNDPIGTDGRPLKNGSGGVNGGITNGAPLVFRVALKPTSSIACQQKTADIASGEMTTLQIPGRHDACFALRTPVVVEAMAAIVLADLL